jgi:hypothetical protein
MEHDNRNRTITMRFEHGQVKLVMEMPYFLDKSPNYQEAKRALDISAISTVTYPYDYRNSQDESSRTIIAFECDPVQASQRSFTIDNQ